MSVVSGSLLVVRCRLSVVRCPSYAMNGWVGAVGDMRTGIRAADLFLLTTDD